MATEVTKKFLNSPETIVDDSLEGLIASNPGIALLKDYRVVVRSDWDQVRGNVALISGGGSGHEPSHAGFVGKGMLTAAVCGAVFASPPVKTILAALKTVWAEGKPSGILLIVKNYTGDRVNFGLALERAKAEDPSFKGEMVVVADDCALTSSDRSAGRRGLAGTVLVHKVAGAMAQRGKSLTEIKSYLEEHILKNMGTVGLSLGPCSLPGQAPSFNLGSQDMELGLGIHGEAGVKRLKVAPASESLDLLLNHMTDPKSATALSVPAHTPVVVLLNNLGGTSNLEIGVLIKELTETIKQRKWKLNRLLVGPLMTSLEMAGISVTILKQSDNVLLEYLDLKVSASGWPNMLNDIPPSNVKRLPAVEPSSKTVFSGFDLSDSGRTIAQHAVNVATKAVSNCEDMLNQMDSGSGDGDCGTTIKTGAQNLVERTRDSSAFSSVGALFGAVSEAAEAMGGSAGAMYSILFARAAADLGSRKSNDLADLARALKVGVEGVMKYGGALPGDRTMLDSLIPAFDALLANLEGDAKKPVVALERAAAAAEKGALDTLDMTAHAGRASYVAKEQLKHPDPGAHAVGIIIRAVYQAVLAKSTELGIQD